MGREGAGRRSVEIHTARAQFQVGSSDSCAYCDWWNRWGCHGAQGYLKDGSKQKGPV